MTHDQVVAEIQRRARARGILSHYCKRGERCEGDRGLPDLLLLTVNGVCFIEVKTPACPTLSSGQTTWRHTLQAAGYEYHILGPGDLEFDGGRSVDSILDELAGNITAERSAPSRHLRRV